MVSLTLTLMIIAAFCLALPLTMTLQAKGRPTLAVLAKARKSLEKAKARQADGP